MMKKFSLLAINLLLISTQILAQHSQHEATQHGSSNHLHQTQSQPSDHLQSGYGQSAHPQNGHQNTDEFLSGDAIRIDSSMIRINRRPSVPFVPFEMQDPKTKAPIAADQMLTLRNGQQVLARDYFAGLNELEKRANELGYSLRDRDTQTPLYEMINESTGSEVQAKDWSSGYTQQTEGALISLTADQMQQDYSNMISVLPVRLEQLRKPFRVPAPVQTAKNFSNGEPGVLSIVRSGKLLLDGSDQRTATTMQSTLDAYLFRRKYNLLTVSANSFAPLSGNVNAAVTVRNEFETLQPTGNWTDPSSLSKSGTISKTYERSQNYLIEILGYPIRITLGMNVTTKCDYSFAVTPCDAASVITPEVESKVFGSGDTWVPSGIAFVPLHVVFRGELTLANYRMPVAGKMEVNLDDANSQRYYQQAYVASERLSALAGTIYAQGCIDFLIDDYCPGWLRFRILSNSGFQTNGQLFSGQGRTYWTYAQPF